MISKASYILKNKSTKKEKIEEGKENIISTWTFKNALLCHLGIIEEQCTIEDLGVILNINVIDNNSALNGICITVYISPRIILLNASINCKQRFNISSLEAFDIILHNENYVTTHSGKQSCLLDSYDIIKTYDDVSYYYCNLVYPLLNEFDRKMRLLLYNTYYILYGDDFPKKFAYYQKTPEGKLYIKSAKKNNTITKFCSDNIFYAYDYSQMIDILFGENNSHSANNKSDWELFFMDKIDFPTYKEDIDIIKRLRNNVAHCKLFSKADYNQLRKLLKKYNNALDKAIELTYSKDFAKEYRSSMENALELMSARLRELFEILAEAYL